MVKKTHAQVIGSKKLTNNVMAKMERLQKEDELITRVS